MWTTSRLKVVHPDMFFAFRGKVEKLASGEYGHSLQVYSKALDLYHLSMSQRKRAKFMVSTDLAVKAISPLDPLPNGDDDSAPGFSIDNPICISFNSIFCKNGKKVSLVSTEGCRAVKDLAESVRAEFTLEASCKAQVVLSTDSGILDHESDLPDPALHQEDNPILVESMTVPIFLTKLDDDGYPTGVFKSKRLFCDADVSRGGVGLRRASEAGEPEDIDGELLTRLHELEAGQKYVLDRGDDSTFDNWQRN